MPLAIELVLKIIFSMQSITIVFLRPIRRQIKLQRQPMARLNPLTAQRRKRRRRILKQQPPKQRLPSRMAAVVVGGVQRNQKHRQTRRLKRKAKPLPMWRTNPPKHQKRTLNYAVFDGVVS